VWLHLRPDFDALQHKPQIAVPDFLVLLAIGFVLEAVREEGLATVGVGAGLLVHCYRFEDGQNLDLDQNDHTIISGFEAFFEDLRGLLATLMTYILDMGCRVSSSSSRLNSRIDLWIQSLSY
jgi:hypothetical protein